MRYLFLYASILPICLLAEKKSEKPYYSINSAVAERTLTVADIPLPPGFSREDFNRGSFGYWLRTIGLKSDNMVFLFNGLPKRNQSAQYAVLNIPVGKKDLQQCADAVMRLRAEYLLSVNKKEEIVFYDNASHAYRYVNQTGRQSFESYLEKVFSRCGTASLEKQLKTVVSVRDIQPGNVFIKGGSPGHAVIVMDMAVNRSGKKIFLLAQSYMPAQDMHILKNPADKNLSPWYIADDFRDIVTPEWTFTSGQLRKW